METFHFPSRESVALSGELKTNIVEWGKIGASGETRTLTSVKKPDFESGASTNSATEAKNLGS